MGQWALEAGRLHVSPRPTSEAQGPQGTCFLSTQFLTCSTTEHPLLPLLPHLQDESKEYLAELS